MEEFKKALEAEGLEAKFWLPKFEKLGVTSKTALGHLGDTKAFSALQKETRFDWEKIALRKLLKIDEKLKAKRDAASALLQELETARVKGEKKHNERVKELEEGVREKLKVESLKSSGESLENLVKKLEEEVGKSAAVQDRDKLGDAALLQEVSGGRALQGVLLTSDLKDQLEPRACLLKLPEKVSIARASHMKEAIASFSSKHQEDSYKTKVNVLGHSVAVSAKAPVYGCVIVGGGSESGKSEKEKTTKNSTQETYSSTVKCSSMHEATYTFPNRDLRLSDDAREDLNGVIEAVKTVSKANVQRACEKFFRTYGSHVNQGPLHFGGHFWQTCSSRGFRTEETENVKELQSEAVTVSAGVSFAGFGVSTETGIDSVKGKFEGKCSTSTLAGTRMTLTVDGGPTEVSDLSAWKAGLVANNSTWMLTDRGNKLVAVWEVIGRNHQKELGEVRELLRKAWEEMTGLTSEPDILPNLKHTPEDVLKEVSEWNEKDLTLQEIRDNLLYLLKVKENIQTKVTDPQYWVEEYLTQDPLQKFLSLIVDSEEGSSLFGEIKFYTKRIIKEEDLKKFSTRTFPGIERVSNLLYPSNKPISSEIKCEDFKSLLDYLQNTLDELNLASLDASEPVLGAAGSACSSSESLATNVSLAIHSLRSNCKGTYEDVLTVILAFPFQIDDSDNFISLKPLSRKDLEDMLRTFTEAQKIYKTSNAAKDTVLQRQSLLIFLAVDFFKTTLEYQFKCHLKKVCQMMKALDPPLVSVLMDELQTYLRGSYTLSQFKNKVEYLKTTGCLPNLHKERPPGEGISLQHVLNTVTAIQSATEPSGKVPTSEKNPAADTLFSKLGLSDRYHEKLGLQDALCIRSEPLKMSLNMSDKPTEPSQLPLLILQKLVSFDYQCRSDLIEGSHTSKSSRKSDGKIHPVDSLLALIICSDPFLRQDLFSRLAKCQIAVPFILPDPFTKELLLPLWAMRSIMKEWKCIQEIQGTETKVVEQTSSIIKYQMPIVSFLRLGKYKKRGESKSRILNRVISESEHFFNRDLSGGISKHVLGDGLVDMCWYLPAGKKGGDVFPDAVTFLNLHGDARKHPQQSKFLSQISSMCFVLLTEEDLKLDDTIVETLKHFSSSLGGVVLLNDGDELPETLKDEAFEVIDLEELNAAAITLDVRQQVKDKLFTGTQFKTIEECCNVGLARQCKIHVDECSGLFREGLERANSVGSLVEGTSNAKQVMLPLQGGDLWRAWGNLNKELYRLENRGKEGVNDYTAVIRAKKASIRSKQRQFVEVLTPLMERFIDLLLTLEGPSNKTARNFFLQCLKLNLNSLSEECISGLLNKYQATRKEIAVLQPTSGTVEDKVKARQENAVEIERCREKLKALQNDIVNASFALHHLFRELSQVYEAACEDPSKYGDQLSRLPKVAAELLLDGYPLEVMDGDAAHVPVKWIQAVIKEVAETLDDPQLFVLSVLGLQSTGKSTMLNTVFGLQFNVSAGRCTRGAFMQLLPVDETIKAATKYSYVLVIDTEGLRTPELDSAQTRKHDNELATFIIGLANVTFINISGEVAGDLDDILQTTVHAFLRMNKVKYNPSCQFIHQNSGASSKGQVGRDNFSEQLDKWTRDAASEESCVGQYEKFSDVIQFDDQKDVHHFPGLWKGDPPMAPVNQGYSQAAQGMKLNLLEKLYEEAQSTNVSSFNRKVSDLWGALLQENFVFSFRNTEEITAYNLLEAKFNQWEGTIQAEMLEWERTAANLINSEKIIEKIPDVVNGRRKKLPSFVQSIYDKSKSEMETFFTEDKQKGTLVQWKGKFEKKLEVVKEEWERHADNHCEMLGKGRQAISTFEESRREYTAMIKHEAQKVILELKKEQDELDESLEKRKLNHAQLKKIMKQKHRLFSPEKLRKYKQDGLLTEKHCRSNLTESDLEHILCKVLTPEQAKKVLKQGRLTKEELEVEFDKTWVKLVAGLPPVYNTPVDVEKEVERKLTRHVEKFEGAVIEGLQGKGLKEWGADHIMVDESRHYKKKTGSSLHGLQGTWMFKKVAKGCDWMQKNVFRITDPYQNEAQVITDAIFDEAKQCLEDIKDMKTNFNEAYTLDLLQRLEKVIKEKSKSAAEHFTFTRQYRIDVYLTACGYAVEVFEKMAKDFKEQNDPKIYLKKNVRGPLFTKFKNQYFQTAAEEAIADNLCALLGVSIKEQIEGNLGAKVVGRMKSEAYLSNKMSLKAKILIDLGTNPRDFEKYVTYFTNTKQSLRDWIERYTIEYCNEEASKTSSDGTQLQALAKDEVSRLILFFGGKVGDVNETVPSEWLSTFCDDEDVRRELGVSLDANDLQIEDEIETLDLENFKRQMRSELGKLEKKLQSLFGMVVCDENEMGKWQDKPFNLLKKLCGCTEQCPFCGEQCDLCEHDTTVKHRISQHRPSCVIGYKKRETRVLSADICPTKVAGTLKFRNKDTDKVYHPYKDYLKIYPNWHIPPDPAAEDSSYWKWFVGQYGDALATYYDVKPPNVPREWTEMKWEVVKTQLKAQYNL